MVIHHTMRMRRIMLSSVAFFGSIKIFHIILSTARFSAKENVLNIKRVLIHSKTSLKSGVILGRIQCT